MTIPHQRSHFIVILILGTLSAVSPFAIDMYLPAFEQMAGALQTTVPQVALSLSSYFIGMAFGQLFYGPLLDRFGRKKPLYCGLILFIIASICCMFCKSVNALIAFRLLQALGGCAAQVACMAFVRDFFPVKDSAKIFSLLMLILSVSPLLAPTFGGLVVTVLGWQWIFVFLAIIVSLILAATFFILPPGHLGDPTVSLHLKPLLAGYWDILKHPIFYTYAFAGAFSFSGLLIYVASSPIIFMDVFQVSPQRFSMIFALLSTAFIGGNQVNILVSKKISSEQIFKMGLIVQVSLCFTFLFCVTQGWYDLYSTVLFFYLFLACLGVAYPNATALTMAPFGHNAGRASALMGFLQIGTPALISAGLGIFPEGKSVTAISLITGAAAMGLFIYFIGRKNIATT